jgi:hypothetical protein
MTTCYRCGQDILPGADAHVSLFDEPVCGPCYLADQEVAWLAVEVNDELDRQERDERREEEYRRLFDEDDAA